ncbi:MAG: cation diffusion facilitator family transporter [Clostridia bacterium]|nr:cation diffusion facilitator family transporter [Clostridia bacterium]
MPVAIATAANLALFGVKLYAGLASSSLCIYTDAVNNLFDALSCLLAAAGIVLAAKGKSADYPDGLGKAEDLVGFVMAVSVAVAGAYFAYRALERFLYPRPVNFQVYYAILLGATVPVKLTLGLAFRRLAKRRDSVIFQTICTDSFSDCGVTAMTLLSFILSEYAGLRADSLFGLAVSAVIIVNGVRLVKTSARRLLGRNDPRQNEEIGQILLSCGFAQAEVKTYAAGDSVTAAAAVTGEGDAQKARDLIRRQTNAELYLYRR